MITTKEAVNKYTESGAGKVNQPIMRMFVLAIMAGMFISFAGVASSAAGVSIAAPSVAKLIAALIFPAGLAMVIFNGTELFTGNNLLIMSVMDKKITFAGMLKNWVVVYIGNMVGSFIVTGLFTLGHVYSLFDAKFADSVVATAVTKCNISFTDGVVKGIFCNILVCIAVINALMAKSLGGKVAGLFLPIMVFVMIGFEHSVANMSYISGGLFVNMAYDVNVPTAGLTWFNFFVTNLVPVTIGNIIGGVVTGVAYKYTNRD